MSNSGRASAATALYITLVGLVVLARPALALRLFATDATAAGAAALTLMRVLGLICLTFGWYYGVSALSEATGRAPPPFAFYSATVSGRLGLGAALAVLCAVGGGSCPILAVLALMNVAGAVSMAKALSFDAAVENFHLRRTRPPFGGDSLPRSAR